MYGKAVIFPIFWVTLLCLNKVQITYCLFTFTKHGNAWFCPLTTYADVDAGIIALLIRHLKALENKHWLITFVTFVCMLSVVCFPLNQCIICRMNNPKQLEDVFNRYLFMNMVVTINFILSYLYFPSKTQILLTYYRWKSITFLGI